MNTVKESYVDGVCPDCGENIPDTVVEWENCLNCGHVFSCEMCVSDPHDTEDRNPNRNGVP